MLRQHLAAAGEGQAGLLTTVIDGFRTTHITSPGLLVQGQSEELKVGVVLIADPLILLAIGGPQQALHWSLLPGGPSVTSRADGPRLIRSLAAGGQLTFQLGQHEPLPPLEVDGGPWEDEDEWRLFEDLAVLEEWSGVPIPMPQVVSAEEATTVAQAASWARTQQIDAQIAGPITFTAVRDWSLDDADELRLHQEFGVEILSTQIPLGEGVALVELDGVERLDVGALTIRASPSSSNVSFLLNPPAGRRLPARRTQPERVFPPEGRGTTGPAGVQRRTSVRPALRQLSTVLAQQRPRRAVHLGNIRGTASLLGEIRGE
jgi:hypothetical protein